MQKIHGTLSANGAIQMGVLCRSHYGCLIFLLSHAGPKGVANLPKNFALIEHIYLFTLIRESLPVADTVANRQLSLRRMVFGMDTLCGISILSRSYFSPTSP